MGQRSSRRRFLQRSLIAPGVALAGCLADDDDEQPPEDDPAQLRFVVITDGHWGKDNPEEDHAAFPSDGDRGLTYRETHDRALEQIRTLHADQPVDCLIANGDIVHDDERLHDELIDDFFEELPSAIDWYPTFGNHDWCTDEEWETIYGHPKQHTFEVGPYGFILCRTGIPRTARHDAPANADPTFIETAIDDFEAADKDAVFGFQHIPPFDRYAGNDMPAVREQWEREIVPAVFCGHNHRNNINLWWDEQRYFQNELIGNRLVRVRRGIRVVDVDADQILARQLGFENR